MTTKTKFQKDFLKFLRGAEKKIKKDKTYIGQETTISEFRRWAKEDLISFNKLSLHEQFRSKIDYEISIGNNDTVLLPISQYVKIWIESNKQKTEPYYVWYHGTIEPKYISIVLSKKIKVSTYKDIQHPEFTQDVGTVSLARDKGDALFFATIADPKNKYRKVILKVDIRKLNKKYISYRTIFGKPKAEILYSKDIPLSAVFQEVEIVN